jgi:hypothetical protein
MASFTALSSKSFMKSTAFLTPFFISFDIDIFSAIRIIVLRIVILRIIVLSNS